MDQNVPEPESVEPPFRSLPSVSSLLADPEIRSAARLSDDSLVLLLREALAWARTALHRGERVTAPQIRTRVLDELRELDRPRLAKILNATGVIVHTNLGRTPVSSATAEAMAEAAGNAVALEVDAESGRRGGRMTEIAGLMRLLTGAQSTLVVNNNAAAVLLVLSAVAAGRDVVLSRGEAVEIGGGFRVPDVLRQSGARLVEVGTTNRTYPADYVEAVSDGTAAFLKVHPSNFVVSGFVRSASIAELAPLARERGLLLIEDLGSGALLDTAGFGLAAEPTIADSLRFGAAIVTASGDKLLGGPQAGIICGDAEIVGRVERHPLARALRADKTCLAGLAETLRHYVRGEAVAKIPVWRQIATTRDELRQRAERAQSSLKERGIATTVVETRATVGGGSLPGETLPSYALAIEEQADRTGSSGARLAARLRVGRPAVYGRIEDNRLLLDLRSVLPEDDQNLVSAIEAATAALD